MGPSLKLLNLMDKTGLEALILCCAHKLCVGGVNIPEFA